MMLKTKNPLINRKALEDLLQTATAGDETDKKRRFSFVVYGRK